MNRSSLLRFASGLAVCWVYGAGGATTIDFEGLADSTVVDTVYSGLGVTFSGATALTSGASLNEFDFPPHSGENVISGYDEPISGQFTAPVSTLSAYLTYLVPVTLYAYDADGAVVGTISSTFAENQVSSGNPPNELLTLTSSAGIMSFSFMGDADGDFSFTLDDFSFEFVPPTPSVADTGSSLALLALSFAGLQFFSRRSTQHRAESAPALATRQPSSLS